MERRTDAVELLDGPLDDPAALAGNLRDLGRINRRLGGAALTAAAIEALAAHRDDLTLLDVGTGGADIPLALIARAGRRGRRIHAVGVDSRPGGPGRGASALQPAMTTRDGLELHVGDGRALPYADRSFDVAHASLVLHHLDPPDAITLLGEMRAGRAARRRGQRPRAQPARLARRVAGRPSPHRQPPDPARRPAVGPARVRGDGDGGACSARPG